MPIWEQAQELGHADDGGATVARLRLLLEGAIVVGMPAPQERGQHAHGVHDLGVAQRRLAAPLGGSQRSLASPTAPA